MKAKLIFDLDNPEDEMEFKIANEGHDMVLALWGILNADQRLSKNCETKYDVYEIKEIIYEHLNRRNICLDELIQ